MQHVTPEPIELVLHGYRHGHEVLASTSSFDDEVANVLANNSDSVPGAKIGDGPFVTGYPLPDRRYVVARTWHVEDAERPNTVTTLSAILPLSGMATISLAAIIEQMSAQAPTNLDIARRALPSEMFEQPPRRLPPEEAVDAARFYSDSAPLPGRTPRQREQIATAIWDQLWLTARGNFWFCTALDTDRFRHARTLRFSGEDEQGRGAFRTGSNNTFPSWAYRDLIEPGPFREFARFVGSGERSATMMRAFSDAFDLLRSRHPEVADVERLLHMSQADRPARLRRLKRRLLEVRDGSPSLTIEPTVMVESLASSEIGHMVYATDASLEQWVRLSWEIDPDRTSHCLRDEEPGTDGALSAEETTANRGLLHAFETQAGALVTAAALPSAIRVSPRAALNQIWMSGELELWRAWSLLDESVPVPTGQSDIDWATPLRAVRASPQTLERILNAHPPAIEVLIRLANDEPADSDLHLELPAAARDVVRDKLSRASDHLRGLARLADARTLPDRLIVDAWVDQLGQQSDDVLHSIGYLIGRQDPRSNWEVLGLAVAHLYHSLATSNASEAWQRLDSQIIQGGEPWDRCGRLLIDYSVRLTTVASETRARAAAQLEALNPTAGQALRDRLFPAEAPPDRHFNLFDPSTWW